MSNPGRGRWLFVAAWALYVVSFILPVVGFVFHPPGAVTPRYGHEIVWGMLRAGILGPLVATIPNGLMLLTLPEAAGNSILPRRWLGRLAGAVALGGIVFGVVITLRGGAPITVNDGPAYYRHLGFGYWAWVLSFTCVAAALWRRDRGHALAADTARHP